MAEGKQKETYKEGGKEGEREERKFMVDRSVKYQRLKNVFTNKFIYQ